MINLLTNIIIFVLRIANAITFGVLDSMGVVYSILVVTSFIVFIKLEATIGVCNVWKKAGIVPKGLILTGLVLNALPQWYLWIAGVILVVLAYSLTPNPDEEDEEPSILERIHDILIEEYHKKGLKNSSKKLEEPKSRKLPPSKLPPVQ